MGLPAAKPFVSVKGYLAAEAVAVERHEYDHGEVLVMVGGSYEHSTIILNAGGELRTRLRGTPCRATEGNVRVAITPGGRYVYPDLNVVCGGPIFDHEDENHTTIVNPQVIIEVLSPSTELYVKIESLREYVLISQSIPKVETFARQPDGRWVLDHWEGLEAVARLRSVEVDLPLAEVYEGIVFAQD